MMYEDYTYKVPAEKHLRVIIDTDFANEADDPFAVTQALLMPRLDVRCIIASHFGTRTPDSMALSYSGLEQYCELLGPVVNVPIMRGAEQARCQRKKDEPLSQGAQAIIDEAKADDERPLFVLFMGPLTNMADALVNAPDIRDKLTVIWIGGGAWPCGGAEFNLSNDIQAANEVMGSGVSFWQVPKNVYEQIPVSLAELEMRVQPTGRLGSWLFKQLLEHSQEDIPRKSPFRTGETWVLGDNPAVGLLLYEHRFEYDLVPAPTIDDAMIYHEQPDAPLIRVYRRIDARLILEDLYARLSLFAARHG